MEHSFDIDRIVIKYVREEDLSPEETAFLQQWLEADPSREAMINDIRNQTDWMKDSLKQMQQTSHSRIWDQLSSRLEEEGSWRSEGAVAEAPVVPLGAGTRWWRRIAAAVAVAAIAGGGYWVVKHGSRGAVVPEVQPQVASAPADAQPGGNRATLTLSNGQQINLDNSGNGVVASQGNMNVTKLGDGQLAYKKASETLTAAALFNTLSTPRAGQFTLTLPDGSRVWLNNASSIRYPVAFSGGSREVELTGEAYFEVAKDAAHPFKVAVKKGERISTIEVLGTSFNIMAYEDEGAERTTLVEGSVRFVNGSASTLLKPEEQSVLDEKGSLKTLDHVNVAEITAWKNGFFHFDHASLQTTMRQLARWYDVDVRYEEKIEDQQFNGMGKIQRNLPLSVVLKGLENEHIHFQLNGRELVVKP
ncbi:FecR domain-containing protein [Puia sp. P3]|uniref:FecR domain-containing protein n=1 Tax=Puia sp. P3 TaxID=3423952 RepID=UPI003D67C5F2